MLIKVNGPFVVPCFETFEEYEEFKTYFFYLILKKEKEDNLLENKITLC
jgi:hypothetical protein